jgi:hypothetical protein
MLLFNSKRIKVHLDYKTNQFDVEVEPYQTMKSFKEIISKVFYGLLHFKILYAGKEIQENDSAIIGDIFKNKINVSVKIIESDYEKRIPVGKVSNRAQEQKKMTIEMNKFLDGLTYERPKIKATSSSMSKWTLKENPKAFCKCSNGKIFYYCFPCGEFFCNICNLQHNLHKSTRIDKDNVEESIKIYSMSLQSEINKTTQKMKECVDLIQNSVFIDRQSRKEMILRKLDDLEKIYEEKITKVEDENLGSFTETVESESTKTSQEIEKIVEQVTYNMLNPAKKQYVNKLKAKEYYDFIFSKEKKMQGIIENVNMYHEYYENCKRVDDMFNVLENTLDKVLDDFNLLNKKRRHSENLLVKSPKVEKFSIQAHDKNESETNGKINLNKLEKKFSDEKLEKFDFIEDINLNLEKIKDKKFETLTPNLFDLNELKVLGDLTNSISASNYKKESTPKLPEKRKIIFNKLDFISREDFIGAPGSRLNSANTFEQRFLSSIPTNNNKPFQAKDLKSSTLSHNALSDNKIKIETLSSIAHDSHYNNFNDGLFGYNSYENVPTYSTKFKFHEKDRERERNVLTPIMNQSNKIY